MKFLVGLLMISLTTLAHAGHHEDDKISKAAKSGQLMVVYYFLAMALFLVEPCIH